MPPGGIISRHCFCILNAWRLCTVAAFAALLGAAASQASPANTDKPAVMTSAVASQYARHRGTGQRQTSHHLGSRYCLLQASIHISFATWSHCWREAPG